MALDNLLPQEYKRGKTGILALSESILCTMDFKSFSKADEEKDDFVRTLEVCDEVTLEEIEKTSSVKKFGQSILRLVAPLL